MSDIEDLIVDDEKEYCAECGEEIIEDASPGVYNHLLDSDTGELDYAMNEDHAPVPESLYGDTVIA